MSVPKAPIPFVWLQFDVDPDALADPDQPMKTYPGRTHGSGVSVAAPLKVCVVVTAVP